MTNRIFSPWTVRRARRTAVVSLTSAMVLGFAAAAAAQATAQDSAAAADSAAKATAACTELKAYAKRKMAESMKDMAKRNQLAKYDANGNVQISIPAAVNDDSTKVLSAAAGSGCKWAVPMNAAGQMAMNEFMSVPHPMLGIELRKIVDADTAGRKMTDTRGVAIKSVRPNSGAQAAGLVADDIIVGMDGKPVTSIGEFQNLRNSWTDGQSVALDIVRKDGKRETVKATAKLSK